MTAVFAMFAEAGHVKNVAALKRVAGLGERDQILANRAHLVIVDSLEKPVSWHLHGDAICGPGGHGSEPRALGTQTLRVDMMITPGGMV